MRRPSGFSSAIKSERLLLPQPRSDVADMPSQGPDNAGVADRSSGSPVRDLPLVGMAFSDDPAERAQFRKQLEEMLKVDNAIREAKDADRNLSFKKLLENLGVAVPAEMSEAEAAAEFLRHIEAARSILAQLRSALEAGPWDWGEYRADNEDMSQRRWEVFRMLQAASNVDSGIIQAHWRAGDSEGAWNDWELMRLLSLRAGGGREPHGHFV